MTTITLRKGIDYHEVEVKEPRDRAAAQEASGRGAERVTRLEGGEHFIDLSVSFDEVERRVFAALHEKIFGSRREPD